MRKLAESEVLTLIGLLKMESDGLAVSRAMNALIEDAALKKQAEAGMLAAEGRIKGLQQFIQDNQVISVEGVDL